MCDQPAVDAAGEHVAPVDRPGLVLERVAEVDVRDDAPDLAVRVRPPDLRQPVHHRRSQPDASASGRRLCAEAVLERVDVRAAVGVATLDVVLTESSERQVRRHRAQGAPTPHVGRRAPVAPHQRAVADRLHAAWHREHGRVRRLVRRVVVAREPPGCDLGLPDRDGAGPGLLEGRLAAVRAARSACRGTPPSRRRGVRGRGVFRGRTTSSCWVWWKPARRPFTVTDDARSRRSRLNLLSRCLGTSVTVVLPDSTCVSGCQAARTV